MKLRSRAVALAAAAGLAAPLMMAGPAQAEPGTTSLGDVLLADTVSGQPSFDNNGGDFDILTAAVLAVLGAKDELAGRPAAGRRRSPSPPSFRPTLPSSAPLATSASPPRTRRP